MAVQQKVSVDGVDLNVAIEGSGPVVVLVHGFPHTWEVWRPIMSELAERHTVLAPDLRGFGDSSKPNGGYSASDVASDIVGIMDALDVRQADVVAMDLGTPAAFLMGLRHPERVRKLVLMEALIGSLPGAEEFLRNGPPWWFGFHAVPALAEKVLAGHADGYIDFFLEIGTRGAGVTPDFRKAAHRAFSAPDALRGAFEHYRALPESARQISAAVVVDRLTIPTLALGASPVGNATFRQLEPIVDDLTGVLLEGSGHIIPQHRPQELLAELTRFLR